MNTNKVKSITELELKSFKLQIERIPNTTFFCTSAPLPGLSTSVKRLTTLWSDIAVHPDKITFQPLIATFIVNEDLSNWREIYDWIVSFAPPDNWQQYGEINEDMKILYKSKRSDGTLILPDNKYLVNKEFLFEDLVPVDLSEIYFDTQIDDVHVALVTVVFEYTQYYPIDKGNVL